jgi:hypothetical protein
VTREAAGSITCWCTGIYLLVFCMLMPGPTHPPVGKDGTNVKATMTFIKQHRTRQRLSPVILTISPDFYPWRSGVFTRLVFVVFIIPLRIFEKFLKNNPQTPLSTSTPFIIHCHRRSADCMTLYNRVSLK